jgi:50S ribosomal subunit-associated GTPase HflX
LGGTLKKFLTFNKVDLLKPKERRTFPRKSPFILTSTFTKLGLNELKLKIKSLNPIHRLKKEIFIPNIELHLEEKLKDTCHIEKIETSSVGKVFYVSIQEKDLISWGPYLQ